MIDEWRIANLEQQLQRVRSDLAEVKSDLQRQRSECFSDLASMVGGAFFVFVISLASSWMLAIALK